MRRAAVIARHLAPRLGSCTARYAAAAAAGVAAAAVQRTAAAGGTDWAAGMGQAAADTVTASGAVQIAMVPCLSDNYCPVLHDPRPGGATLIVDTPDAKPIIAELKRRQWRPTHILNTHHHHDHTGGNAELVSEYPGLQVLGPADRVHTYPGPYPAAGEHPETIPCVTRAVSDGDRVPLGRYSAEVLEVGGHTRGHVAYFFPQLRVLLSGDALFNMGCGRVFTGDFARMCESMKKLRRLPPDTVVYCAHEYTESNAKFALKVEPGNADLQGRVAEVQRLRAESLPTVPTLLQHELATNPFLRFDDPAVVAACGLAAGASDVDAFTCVRRWKDTGKRP